MAIFYLDTSFLVKRYRTEIGTKYVDELLDTVLENKSHKVTTSTLTVLELIAAIRRISKAGLISQSDFNDLLLAFVLESEHISLRPMDETILIQAVNVVMEHAMRTADSIHLATVLELKNIVSNINEKIILCTNDEEMVIAGKKEGLNVIEADDADISILHALLSELEPNSE